MMNKIINIQIGLESINKENLILFIGQVIHL